MRDRGRREKGGWFVRGARRIEAEGEEEEDEEQGEALADRAARSVSCTL